MAAKCSTAPDFVWNWVIEALASCGQVDVSTLRGLVKMAPGISGDAGKDAREVVALRILESLFSHGNETIVDNHGADSTQKAKISFDVLESCEDVLNKILHKQTPELMSKLEHEKWDVSPFLMHKRSSLPKCLLIKLKEAMVESSSHPLLASLKERSKLVISNVSEDMGQAKDDSVLHPRKDENKVQEKVLQEADLVRIPAKGTTEDGGIEEREIIIESPIEGSIGTKLMEVDVHAKGDSVLNTGKDKNKLQENVLQETDQVHDCAGGTTEHVVIEECEMIIGRPLEGSSGNKLMELDKIQENVLHEADQVQNPAKGTIEHAEIEESEMIIERPLEGLGGNKLMEHDAHDKTQHGDDNIPQEIRVSVDMIVSLELAKSKDPKNVIQPNYERVDDDERIDITAKKDAFFNSQLTMTELSQIDLCVKCNEGGQLLVCSSESCSLRVHESCLGTAVTLDDSEEFFCPFCAYSRAISLYLEAKRKVSLARKDLQAFSSLTVKHGPKKSSKKQSELEKNETRSFPEATEETGNGNTAGRASTINCMSNEQDSVLPDPLIPVVNDDMHIETESLNQQTTELPQNPIPEPSTKKQKCKENESQRSIESSFRGRLRKRKAQYTPPPLPSFRRNKLSWTKYEEEILKEGVKRYPCTNNKGIPWKEILDFGSNVFHKGRTTVDLKDKWRNICKGSPNVI